MLSRLVESAKSFLNPISQVDKQPSIGSTTAVAEDAMVTTRGQSGNHRAAQTTKLANVVSMIGDIRGSSKEHQIFSESEGFIATEEDVTPRVKRQKILPVREKDTVEPVRNTRVVVEIPVSALPLESSRRKNDSARESADMLGFDGDNEAAESEIIDAESGNERPAVDMDGDSKVNPTKPKLHAAGDSVTQQLGVDLPPVRPRHKRFDSAERDVEIFSTALEKMHSEDDSSDDDAPEVVVAQDGFEEAQSTARKTAMAIELQESTLRAKRKKRDAILKRQADSASKKRKRAAEVSQNEQIATTLGDIIPTDILGQRQMNSAYELGSEVEKNSIRDDVARKRNLNLACLPEMLPAEYLEDGDVEGSLYFEPKQPTKKAKKSKFVDLLEKKSKDRRKGSTTFRVSETLRSGHLAPKASFQARSTKETWLKGRSGKSIGINRKPFSSGFFKSKR